MAGVPYVFGNATTSITLTNLDANFNTGLTIGNTTVGLGNTVTTLGNVTLTNVNIVSGTVPTANSIVNGTSNVVIVSSGGAVNIATNGTQAITVDTSQNVGIGASTPLNRLHVSQSLAGSASSSAGIARISNTRLNTGDGASTLLFVTDEVDGNTQDKRGQIGGEYDGSSGGRLVFSTAQTTTKTMTERMRIDSSGNLLIGGTANAGLLTVNGSGSQGTRITQFQISGVSNIFSTFYVSADSSNGAATAVRVGQNTSTSRSINAGGTVNASGLDYAEYMVKAGNFVIAKGDICGIDLNGKLTNVFADAISFVVKSTNPSYVGGDSWGEDLQDGELESVRQTVDRIAFSGQVPVNVNGATVGQYIVPINNNGAIKGETVSNPTFEQYQLAVGKVIAIESDGRARIIVKVV